MSDLLSAGSLVCVHSHDHRARANYVYWLREVTYYTRLLPIPCLSLPEMEALSLQRWRHTTPVCFLPRSIPSLRRNQGNQQSGARGVVESENGYRYVSSVRPFHCCIHYYIGDKQYMY